MNLSTEEEQEIGIWHIENRTSPSIRLWPMDQFNFRVSESGNYTGVLTNPTYTLIRKQYGTVFKEMYDQVSFKPAMIFDLNLKTETDAYASMRVTNKISPDTINQLDFSGDKVWIYDGDIFVSRTLKQKLAPVSSDELWFSPGFSLFG
ncbi:MAG: hypothetical protein J7527_02720 [Chitinophagaceae bacterium]|nr:hypothetical protein [Chitinophagaceae bacterium]